MRFSMAVLLLAAFTSAADLKSRSRQKSEEVNKTDKRALAEGNTSIEKRLAIIPAASSSESPGIVYADAKETLAEKSPIQQIYTPPGPQIAKISDVLTGHGPAFPAAIASHLYSPISVYQPKLATPTTYEVSAPVPSQLAYAEKISYQSPVQFTTQVLYNQQPQFTFPRYNPVHAQQALQQQNPRLFTHPQTFQAPQLPQIAFNLQPQYQNPQYQNGQNPQVIYSQVQQQLAQLAQTVQPQPGIVYARQESGKANAQPIRQELNKKAEQPASQGKSQTQNQNTQLPAAVSFASFSQGQPTYNQQQPQKQIQAQNQYQIQPQLQEVRPQPQYQAQGQPQYQPQVQPQFLIHVPSYQQQVQTESQAQEQRLYQNQEQPQPQIQYQPQAPPQFQIQVPQYQPQIQYQQPQLVSKLESPNSITNAVKPIPTRQVVYLRQVPQQYQPQVFQAAPQPGLAFPAVQYFGKFAHEIFGGYQQNQ